MMTCKRCRCIMYPYSSGSSLNHKPGYCSDGAPVKAILEPVHTVETPDKTSSKVIPWPQPEGIFTTGNRFHPIPFLQSIRNLYQRLVEENIPHSDLDLEFQAFLMLCTRSIITDIHGNILFKIPSTMVVDPFGANFVTEFEGYNYLRLDCLRDDPSNSLEVA